MITTTALVKSGTLCLKIVLSALETMHVNNFFTARCSAKRGIAIACRPSVRLSVTLVYQDHIGWKSWKLILYGQLAQHLRSP